MIKPPSLWDHCARLAEVKRQLRERFAAKDWNSRETYRLASEFEALERSIKNAHRKHGA